MPEENFERTTLMPSQFAQDYLRRQLMRDPTFKAYYNAFTKEGFKFIPERVQLAMGISTTDGSPVLLAVVPSFREFDPAAASHEAVSIAAFRNGPNTGVVAGRVVVNHRPYQISSLSIVENSGGKLVTHTVERDVLTSASAKRGRSANLLPAPKTLGRLALGTLTTDDIQALAQRFYQNLLMDSYAKPLYPPDGLEAMTADTTLVQRFALAQNSRFTAQSSARALKISGKCTSTSTSSNACSSTSTSFTISKAA